MNHKQDRKWLPAVFLAVFSITLFNVAAQAQNIAGSFTLPCKTHWGPATLPAGHYTFAARTANLPFILTVRGEGTVAMIMAGGQNRLTNNHNSLRIIRKGNEAVVSSLQLALYGVRFEYGSHRPLPVEEAGSRLSGKTETATILAQAAVEVPLAVSGQ